MRPGLHQRNLVRQPSWWAPFREERQTGSAVAVSPPAAQLVQAAWTLLLHDSTGDRDVLFGNVVAGRPDEVPGADRIVGYCNLHLPTRVSVDPRRHCCAGCGRAARRPGHPVEPAGPHHGGEPGPRRHRPLRVVPVLHGRPAPSRAEVGSMAAHHRCREHRTSATVRGQPRPPSTSTPYEPANRENAQTS